MMPVHTKETLIQTQLPDDPEPGEVFILPEGQTIGGANVINVFQGPSLLGAAQSLAPVPNVSGVYFLERLATRNELKPRDILRVKATQYTFIELTFIEYLGWCGTKMSDTTYTAFDKHLKVRDIVPIGTVTDGFNLYERICLEKIKGAKNAKPTE